MPNYDHLYPTFSAWNKWLSMSFEKRSVSDRFNILKPACIFLLVLSNSDLIYVTHVVMINLKEWTCIFLLILSSSDLFYVTHVVHDKLERMNIIRNRKIYLA